MTEARVFIQAMAKHLPPSGANLRLLDVGGLSGAVLAEDRADLNITTAQAVTDWQFMPDSFDSVVAYSIQLTEDFLEKTLAVLRPGGRLTVVDPDGGPGEILVTMLANAGYVRILVEPALDSGGVLMRGEKPHTEERTVDRIRQVADRDDVADLPAYKGRYVHLLIRQMPNKPVWALKPGERVEWYAVALAGDLPTLLAFSSLPKAVAFMQPAVMSGLIKDINKVAKFSRETAQTWTQPLLFNPIVDDLGGLEVMLLPIDPTTAETADE